MCVYLCVSYVCISQKRVSGLLELGLQAVVSCPTWLLYSVLFSKSSTCPKLLSHLSSKFSSPYVYRFWTVTAASRADKNPSFGEQTF